MHVITRPRARIYARAHTTQNVTGLLEVRQNQMPALIPLLFYLKQY